MSLVLAIEPDAQQAEAVRQIVRERIGAELMLVNSTYAAVAAMNRRVPDLILLGATISDKGQTTIIRHLRSLTQAADQQALVIPPLGQDEPVAEGSRAGLRRKRHPPKNKHAEFADVIGGALERTRKARRGREPLPRPRGGPEASADLDELDGAEPASVESSIVTFDVVDPAPNAVDPGLGVQALGPEPQVPDTEDDGFVTVELESLVEQLDPDADAIGGESARDTSRRGGPSPAAEALAEAAGPPDAADQPDPAISDVEARIHAAQIALIQADAEARLAHELERARAEAKEEQRAQLGSLQAEADALRAAAQEARAVVESELRDAFAAQLGQVRSDADNTLADTVLRIRSEADQTLEAEVARVRVEAEPHLRAELERARTAADEARLAEHNAKLETVRRAADLALVRADSEAALAAAIDRAREEAAREHRLQIARLQAEAEALRDTAVSQARAEADAYARDVMSAEVARARADADSALATTVQQVRSEAERTLAAELSRVRFENEAAVNAADAARRAAEAAAAQTLDREVARVRFEAEARLEAELNRALAAADARVPEHDLMLAARKHDADIALVKADADARLAAGIERARQEAAGERLDQMARLQAEADALRHAAVSEARAAADASARETRAVELAKVRSEADTLLAETVQRLRNEAAQTLAAELSHARAQAEQAAHQLERTEADAEHRLCGVIERMQDEAGRARRAEQSETHREAERRLGEAIGKVRSELEEAGARALAAEVARLSAEATSSNTPAAPRRAVDVLGIRGRIAPVQAATVRIGPPDLRPNSGHPERQSRGEGGPLDSIDEGRDSGHDVSGAAVEPTWDAARAVIPWPRVSRGTLAAAAAVLLVAAGSLFVDVAAIVRSAGDASAAWLGGEASQPTDTTPATAVAAAPVAPRVGTLRVESTPGARVMLDGQDRGVSPLTLADLRPGRHALVLQNDSGTVRRTVTIRAGEQAIAADQIISGFLTVFSRIRLDIYLAGQRIGTTEDGQLLVAPGRHRFTLVSDRYNYTSTVVLDVQPGAATPHTVSLPNGALRVATTPGAEVWIEGERLGTAPLGEVPVQIGTREILVTSPDLGERRQVVEVRYGQPTEVTLPLERTPTESRDVEP